VRTVAKRFFEGVFAAAHGQLSRRGQIELDGLETAALVRTVAERLALGLAAGTPPVGTGLEVEDIGAFLGDFGFYDGSVT